MRSMTKSLRRVAVTGIISTWSLRSCISNSDPEKSGIRTPSAVAVSDAKVPGHPSAGVNPFDCVNPACSSKMDLLKNAMKKQKKANIAAPLLEKSIDTKITDTADFGNADSIPSELTELKNTVAANNTVDELSPETLPEIGCPLDKEELGRSTWDLIHTIAAYYPDSPNDTDKENARNFISSVSYLYPCEVCREDFKQSVAKFPPQ